MDKIERVFDWLKKWTITLFIPMFPALMVKTRPDLGFWVYWIVFIVFGFIYGALVTPLWDDELGIDLARRQAIAKAKKHDKKQEAYKKKHVLEEDG